MEKRYRKFLISVNSKNIILMFSKKYPDIFSVFCFIICFFSICSITFRMPSAISSVCFYGSVIIVFLWFVCHLIFLFSKNLFWWKENRTDVFFDGMLLNILIIGILFYFLNVILSFPLAEITFSSLKKAIITASCIIALYLFSFSSFSEATKRIFLWVCLFSTICLLASAIIFSKNSFWHPATLDSLLLGFENPNSTGLLLGLLASGDLLGFFYLKKTQIRFIFLFGFWISCAGLILTKSRNSIFSFVLCFAIFLFLNLAKDKYKKGWGISWLITFLPLLASVLYILIYANTGVAAFVEKIFSFLLPGKSLSTRTVEWSIAYRFFGISPIFGSYYSSLLKSVYLSGYLNAYLDWLVEGGILPTIIFTSLVLISVIKCQENAIIEKTKYALAAYSFYAFLFLSSTFESGFFFGFHGLFLLIMFIPSFSKEIYETDSNRLCEIEKSIK